jgi:hypothetical protein
MWISASHWKTMLGLKQADGNFKMAFTFHYHYNENDLKGKLQKTSSKQNHHQYTVILKMVKT